MPLPWAILNLAVSGIAIGYGIAVIAMAPGRRLKLVPPGIDANAAATAWFGLAFVASIVVAYAAAFLVRRVSPATGDLALLVWFAAPLAAFFGCAAVAFLQSNRDVKRAIVSGQARSYAISSDACCWWDGTQWVSVVAAAPEGALRSPDGNYWWTGLSWLALPPDSLNPQSIRRQGSGRRAAG